MIWVGVNTYVVMFERSYSNPILPPPIACKLLYLHKRRVSTALFLALNRLFHPTYAVRPVSTTRCSCQLPPLSRDDHSVMLKRLGSALTVPL